MIGGSGRPREVNVYLGRPLFQRGRQNILFSDPTLSFPSKAPLPIACSRSLGAEGVGWGVRGGGTPSTRPSMAVFQSGEERRVREDLLSCKGSPVSPLPV